MMAREDVDVVRLAVAAFNTRDADGMVGLCKPDVEFASTLDALGGGVYRGHGGIRRYFSDLADAFDAGWRAEAERYVDAGECVVVVLRLIGEGRASGVPLQPRIAHVWLLRDRQLWRGQAYLTVEEAFAAVGLNQ